MATIKYFIPEDGDIEDQPNVFLAPKPAQPGFSPKLGEIKNAFPLPGKYHFRFKSPLVPGSDRDKDCIAVWMDCVDDNQHVSVWRGGIFAKVTRMSLVDSSSSSDSSICANDASMGYNVNMSSHSIHSSTYSSASSSSVSSTTNGGVSQPSSTTPVVTETLLDVFDTPSTLASSVPLPPPSMISTSNTNNIHSSIDPLINLFGGPTEDPTMSSTSSSIEGSLLDMNAPVYASNPILPTNNYSSSVHTDFMGMTITPTSTNNDIHNTAPQPVAMSHTVLPMMNTPTTTASTNTRPMPTGIQSKLPPNRSGSTFSNNTFSNKGPFGDLGWK